MPARTVGWLLWLALGGLAALALFWQIGHPPQPPTVGSAGPPPELPAVEPLEPFQLPPLARYGEVTARPLFIAERRPEPPPPDDAAALEKPPAGPEQKFLLFGVMIAPGIQAALLRPEEPNAKTARIKVGEVIGEWRLYAVFPDRVVLRKGEATQDLPLTRPRKLAKPRAKRAGAQPGQNVAPPASAPLEPGMPGAPQPNAPTPLVAPAPTQSMMQKAN